MERREASRSCQLQFVGQRRLASTAHAGRWTPRDHETAAVRDHSVCDFYPNRWLRLAPQDSARCTGGSNSGYYHDEWLPPASMLPRLQRLSPRHISQLDGRGGKDSNWVESGE